MALDVYVMPLWKFKAGDFTSPIEATLGIKPASNSPATQPLSRFQWYLHLLAKIGIVEPPLEMRRAIAMQEVDALKAQLTEMTGIPINWSDNGAVHYNRQFYDPSVLQAFAAWHDHREELPVFLPAPKLRYYKHPVHSLSQPAGRRFPALTQHNLHTGYFLPVPFDGIIKVEPFKVRKDLELFHDVVSTQTVMQELSELLEFIATVPEAREEEHGSIPVADARWYAEELQRIRTLSIEHSLPVIFFG